VAPVPTQSQVRDRRRAFRTPLIVCLGTIVGIHVLPGKPAAPHADLRLFMTIAYFVAVIGALLTCLRRRERYLDTLYKWQYANCSNALRKAWQGYLFSLNSLVRILVYLALVFATSTGVLVLDMWWGGLTPLHGIAKPASILSLGALLLTPLYLPGRFSEVSQRRRLLHELVATSEFRKRKVNALKDPDGVSREAISVRGEQVFRAGGHDWSWDDLYKNAVVFGQSGTGKTLCVLNALLDGLLASSELSGALPGGLILDPKGDYRSKIQTLCERYRREGDLLVIDPSNPRRSVRWNPLDSAEDAYEIASRFTSVLEALGQKNEKDTYFLDSARKFMRHAIKLVRLTNDGRPPSMVDIWRLASSFSTIAARAELLEVNRMTEEDDVMLDFFADEWFSLAPETRTSVQSTLTNMIDPFLSEPYRTLFSGESTLRVSEMVDRGKILYICMPIAEREAMSRMMCTFLKLEYFYEVLRRPNKSRSTFFLCDEFQCYLTTGRGASDPDFFERSRQSNHANVIATQNLPALLKYTERKEPVDNLLGNCSVKIFLRNTDDSTNKYAAELFGQELVGMPNQSIGDMGVGRKKQGVGGSLAYQYDHVIRPEAFVGLHVPARGGSDFCETIVHLGSREEVTMERLRWKVHPLEGAP